MKKKTLGGAIFLCIGICYFLAYCFPLPTNPGTPLGSPELIEFTEGDALDPQIAVDPDGNAIAVWEQHVGDQHTRSDVLANRYVASTDSWGTPQLLETSDAGTAAYPQIAMDDGGNAIAVWSQYDGTRYNNWAKRYSAAGGSWGTAELIETHDDGNAGRPQIDMDSEGNAIAIWLQDDDPGSDYQGNLWANRRDASTGSWGTAVLIETNDSDHPESYQIAVDHDGNAIAVWMQDNDPGSSAEEYYIWVNRYTAATGSWGTPENLGGGTDPQIAMDSNGNAIAVFDSGLNILACRYNSTAGSWGTADQAGLKYENWEADQQIAMDPSGNAAIVWTNQRVVPSFERDVWANSYDAAAGSWGTAELIINTALEDVGEKPNIAMDSEGNAIAVWNQNVNFYSNAYNLFANKYHSSSGSWDTPKLISNDLYGMNTDAFPENPQIVIDTDGNALVVWDQREDISLYGGIYNIWANRFAFE